MTSSMPIGVQ